METKKYQDNLVEDIRRVLEKNDVPLGRVQELAKAALDLDERFPEGIPDAEAVSLLDQYRDIARTSIEAYRQQKKDAETSEINEIRRTLGIEDKE